MQTDGKKTLVDPLGDTQAIMQEVVKCFEQYKGQTREFAQQFRGATDESTARNIWRYLKGNIRYQLDPPAEQWIKTPARVVADREADCKGYSILTASLLYSLGLTPIIRFVSFHATRKAPTHVYVVARGRSGREWVIDGCLPQFDTEKPYTFKQDYMTQISRLSGTQDYYYPAIGKTVLGKLIQKVGNTAGKVIQVTGGISKEVAQIVPGGKAVLQATGGKTFSDVYANVLTKKPSSNGTALTPTDGSTPPPPPAPTGGNNTMLYAGLALAAVFVLTSKKRKK